MTLVRTLQQTAQILSINNIEDAYFEARVLLGHVVKKSPVDLYSEPAYKLSQRQMEKLQELLERRLHREPTAYITNHKEFYGFDFYVDRRVLIPRPETELLVELASKFARSRSTSPTQLAEPFVVADIGTGCGNIAVTLALTIPNIKVYAVDISPPALVVAGRNCRRHKVTDQVTLLKGNLLEPVSEPVDLVLANLPYITTPELATLSPEIYHFEPMEALDGGREGLDLVDQLLRQVSKKMPQPCCLLLEVGAHQEQSAATLVQKHLPRATFKFIRDLNSINRVIEITT